MGLDNVIMALILENNIPWRMIGKRRKLKPDMILQLNNTYSKAVEWQPDQYQVHNIDLEILQNRISLYKSHYWDTREYERLLE